MKKFCYPIASDILDPAIIYGVSTCQICKDVLKDGDDLTIDHDHYKKNNNVRGYTHAACNRKYFIPTELTAVIHNLKGYDAHLIILGLKNMISKKEANNEANLEEVDKLKIQLKKLKAAKDTAQVERLQKKIKGLYFDGFKMKCIAQNSEKYISFTLSGVRYIDSLAFLLASLDKCAESLRVDEKIETAKYILETFGEIVTKDHPLLKKGIFPYELLTVDNWKTLFKSNVFPDKESFTTVLSGKISDKDYIAGKSVFTRYCKTFEDFHDIYLALDCTLLADVFTKFRTNIYQEFGLDAVHYYTAPGLSWACFLKTKQHKVSNLTDIDILNIVEQNIRGGVSVISKRYAKANNPKVAGYDPSVPESYLMYLDANNLYGWAMQQMVPIDAGRFVDKSLEDLLTHDCKSNLNYIVVCDIDYSDPILQEKTKWYPFAPESLIVDPKWLSPKQIEIKTIHGITDGNIDKLIPNQMNKTRYACLLNNLQFYVKHGLKITKVHECIEFEQAPLMRAYIDHNSVKRKAATTDALKDLFKLLNNAIYGKTLENVRNRITGEVVASCAKIQKLVNKHDFLRLKTFGEGLAFIERKKREDKINKPIHIGFFVLEYSKLLMYQFFYDVLQPTFGQDKVHLLMTDTDSLVLQIFTRDLYGQMANDSTKLHNQVNKWIDTSDSKIPGLFKDECGNDIMTEFVGLRSKMYSYRTQSMKKAKNIAKGVTRIVSKGMNFDDYRDVITENKILTHNMHGLRSFAHEVHLIEMNKITLSPYDDKRYFCADNYDTLPYGHYKAQV